MNCSFLAAAALTAALVAPFASAQTVFRCDGDGKTVYSENACPPGSAVKPLVPTQETPEQKSAAAKANEQIRKDNAYVDKRLDDRYKRETTRGALVTTSTAKKSKRPAKGKASKIVLEADETVKRGGIGKAKKQKRTNAKATPKKDTRSYRPAPKA